MSPFEEKIVALLEKITLQTQMYKFQKELEKSNPLFKNMLCFEGTPEEKINYALLN